MLALAEGHCWAEFVEYGVRQTADVEIAVDGRGDVLGDFAGELKANRRCAVMFGIPLPRLQGCRIRAILPACWQAGIQAFEHKLDSGSRRDDGPFEVGTSRNRSTGG